MKSFLLVWFIIWFIISSVNSDDFKLYNNYKMYKIYPENENKTDLIINKFYKVPGYDFWKLARFHGIDVLVEPEKNEHFQKFLKENHYNYSIRIEDLAENIVEKMSQNFRRQMTVPKGTISFNRFERYDTMVKYMEKLAKDYPNIVKFLNIGETYEGRSINGVKISTPGENKPIIFIDGAMHAREWLAPPVVLYIIKQLVENVANRVLFADINWYLFPVMNPDGYEYSFKERMWRKNRHLDPKTGCIGVDINRNFPLDWNNVGTSDDPCSDIYAGKSSFSELETQNMRDFVRSINRHKNIKLYLTFHSYGKLLLHPWGYNRAYPKNVEELKKMGETFKQVVKSFRNTLYTVGSAGRLLYESSGGADDYMKSIGVPLVYTVELPGGDFVLPASEIKPTVRETFRGILAFASYVLKKYANNDYEYSDSKNIPVLRSNNKQNKSI